MARKRNLIYVQIASYRDPELLPTIKDAIDKAKHPTNLRFGIAWQHSPYDEWDTLDEYLNDSRFRIIDIDYRDATGVPSARNKLNKLWQNEKYTLQLDSHHRFVENWDVKLIKMLEDLRNDDCPKPLLTSYLPSYKPDNDPDGRIDVPWIMEFDRIAPEGPVHFLPHSIDNFKELKKAVPTRFCSGHFIFTDGKFCEEVEYDPEYYFHGEEINLSVRSYMAGYDLFAPHRILAYHEYTREGKIKHWDDHTNWGTLDKQSHKHGRELLGIGETSIKKLTENVRSLSDYELYAGISFSGRKVHVDTINKRLPPVSTDMKHHLDGLASHHKIVINVYKENVPEEDYTFWAVALEDKDGNEIHREDASVDEVYSAKNKDPNNDFLQLWRTFYHDSLPARWIVWPHSESKGWCERLVGDIDV